MKKVVQIAGTYREFAWRRKPLVKKTEKVGAEKRLQELIDLFRKQEVAENR
jgi:hypothetical protein